VVDKKPRPEAGVTNITNIIYNFNLTPSQQPEAEQQRSPKQRPHTTKQSSLALAPPEQEANASIEVPPRVPSGLRNKSGGQELQKHTAKIGSTVEVLKQEMLTQKDDSFFQSAKGQPPSNRKRPNTGSVNNSGIRGVSTTKDKTSEITLQP
jgi:hypothetical protein